MRSGVSVTVSDCVGAELRSFERDFPRTGAVTLCLDEDPFARAGIQQAREVVSKLAPLSVDGQYNLLAAAATCSANWDRFSHTDVIDRGVIECIPSGVELKRQYFKEFPKSECLTRYYVFRSEHSGIQWSLRGTNNR